jgi:hypothetical protein
MIKLIIALIAIGSAINLRAEDYKCLSARVVGSGKGQKKVEVVMIAGSKPITVRAYWRDGGRLRKGYPKVYNLKAGEKKTITYVASNEYIVKAWAGKELVDVEAWNSKTGL